MNSVSLIGRMTKDPEVRYTQDGKAVARFTVAVNRTAKDQTDFPNIICFGKTAELVEKYCAKGKLLGISGSISTGSYEKDGRKVYTTEVLASRVEFLSKGEERSEEVQTTIPGFTPLSHDEDIPF